MAWLGQDIIVEEKNLEWLQKCWVGRLRDPSFFDGLNKILIFEDSGRVKLTYLGDDMM